MNKKYHKKISNRAPFSEKIKEAQFYVEIIKNEGYEVFNWEEVYEKHTTKFLVECSNGHQYYTSVSKLKSGYRCSICKGNKRNTTEEFKEEVKNTTNGEFELVGKYKTLHEKVLIRHNECDNTFLVRPANFRLGNRCPHCKQSKGEKVVKRFLEDNKVKYIPQYGFDDCKDKNVLRFDFAVFKQEELKCLIEYDGKQHFEPIEFFGGIDSYELTKKKDNIKNDYCHNKNIALIRIPYWEYENINKILNAKLSVFF